MTRHLLRLVWNRKRTTLLVMAEIAAAFLVLFAVAAFAVYAFDNWRRPVGFTWEGVWDIEMDRKHDREGGGEESVRIAQTGTPEGGATTLGTPGETTAAAPPPADPAFQVIAQLLLALREFPEIEAVAASAVAPFELGGMENSRHVRGRRVDYGANEVSDSYGDLLGVRLARGRWFGPEDVGQAYDAAVVNREMATLLFGDEDPIGKPIVELDAEELARGDRPSRIVGVVEAYREDGEFDGQRYFALSRKSLEGEAGNGRVRPPRHLLIRVAQGTTAQLEERLVRRLQAVAPTWSFEVRRLADMRDTSQRLVTIPLAVIGLLAASLLLMVGLGLLGVLWQAVTQRTREIGLRRAKGAARADIATQILAEIVIMTTLALVPAVIVALQVPLLGPFYWVQWHVYAIALAISLGAIYVLAVACGWYPARLAAAVQPAEALRYE
jgi:putative ABC transport system permease protein